MKWIVYIFLTIVIFQVKAFAGLSTGEISEQGDTLHIEFSGKADWDYEIEKGTISGMPVIDLYIEPIDEVTSRRLVGFKNNQVNKIVVRKNALDGKDLVSLFLNDKNTEYFDYLTDQPSRLVIDLYLEPKVIRKNAEEQNKNQATNKNKKEDKLTKNSESSQYDIKNALRQPAATDILTIAQQGLPLVNSKNLRSEQITEEKKSEENRFGIFDAADPKYERFTIKDYEIKEEAILRSKDNYYIPFPMMEAPLTFWDQLKVSPTIYEITPKDNDENKQARLLLNLFDKKRYLVYLRALEWFKSKYPNSQYNEIIDFMTADVHFTMWQEKGSSEYYDKAMVAYKLAIKKYPQSILAERTSFKLGNIAFEKGDDLAALRLYQEHIDNPHFNTNNFSKDLAKIGQALSYRRMNRAQDALKIYEQLEKNSKNKEVQSEAAFRSADVYVKEKQYDQSVTSYQRAIQKFPESALKYPNAIYNQAESLFNSGKYTQSLDLFRDFIIKFPKNDHAPFAMTRIGELLEILGADRSRVIGAYLETYFRYGESPSAIIARVRLLSARMKGMKQKELDHAVNEISNLSKKLELPNIIQFSTIMISDGYTSRGEFQKATDLLVQFYQENPTTKDKDQLTRRIVTNINNRIRNELEKNQFIQALKTHNEFEDTWLKNSKRLDTKYYVGKAFEIAGAPKAAEKYYKETLNSVYSILNTQQAKELKAIGALPSPDLLNLRLALVMDALDKPQQAYDHLKNIKNTDDLTDREQIERVNLSVKLLEKKGDSESAIRYLAELLKHWHGQPELLAEPYFKLAQLELNENLIEDAIKSLEQIEKLQNDSGNVPGIIYSQSLEKLGSIYLSQNQTDKAIKSYEKLLDKFENDIPLASIRYKLGEIYFQRGEVKKASQAWSEFKGKNSELWQKLAREQLKNSEWQEEYKKYIKRIPAMSNVK